MTVKRCQLLGPLMKLKPVECGYGKLKEVIDKLRSRDKKWIRLVLMNLLADLKTC